MRDLVPVDERGRAQGEPQRHRTTAHMSPILVVADADEAEAAPCRGASGPRSTAGPDSGAVSELGGDVVAMDLSPLKKMTLPAPLWRQRRRCRSRYRRASPR